MAGRKIEHVVALVFENRSFDHLLGWLAEEKPELDGLGPQLPWAGRAPDDWTTGIADPAHELPDVNLQLFGTSAPGPRPLAPAPLPPGPFVQSYAARLTPGGHDDAGRPFDADYPRRILDCFTPAQAPVFAALAREFVVCDRWFAAVPGPTWPNRFFLHCGGSSGLARSPSDLEAVAWTRFGSCNAPSTFNRLREHGLGWRIYCDPYAQSSALGEVFRHSAWIDFGDGTVGSDPEAGLRPLEQFVEDAAAGDLPAYSFLEPHQFILGPHNDLHPSSSLQAGETLLRDVYQALRSNEEVWQKSLLVVITDEPGGFYDHVPPPAAWGWAAARSADEERAVTARIVAPDDTVSTDPPFAFDRLGGRVPALLISPWLARGHVDHTVYDHSSLVRSLFELLGQPTKAADGSDGPLQPIPPLTRRDAAAASFAPLLLAEVRKGALAAADVPAPFRVPNRGAAGG